MATRSVTDPIEQEHAAVVHVEMGFDAFGLGVSVLLEAAADSGQLDRGQVQRAEHAAEHEQGERTRTRRTRRTGFILKYIQIRREQSGGSKQNHTVELLWKHQTSIRRRNMSSL